MQAFNDLMLAGLKLMIFKKTNLKHDQLNYILEITVR
jgi:hypothetical protein